MTTEHNEQASYTATDMADQGAAQFRAGYAAAKAEQPAAAQEAVADVQTLRAVQVFIAGRFGEHDGWAKAVSRASDRAAATVTAAPADAEEDAYVIEQTTKLLAEIAMIVNGPEPAGTRWSYHDLPAKVRALASTPAAPGIDLTSLVPAERETPELMMATWHEVAGWNACVAEIRRRIDASHKGTTLNEQFGSAEGLESPKGGSEARDAALNTLAIMFHNSEEIEGPDGMAVSIDLALWHEALEAYEVLIGDYDEVTLATSAQAQAGDAEVQP